MPAIHAYFESMHEARKALNAMMKAGLSKVYLDLSGVYDYEYSSEIADSPGDISCLPPLVTKSGGCLLEPGISPLIAAGTAISGLSHSEDSMLLCAKLIANIEDVKKEAAGGIIKANGGRIFPTFIE